MYRIKKTIALLVLFGLLAPANVFAEKSAKAP